TIQHAMFNRLLYMHKHLRNHLWTYNKPKEIIFTVTFLQQFTKNIYLLTYKDHYIINKIVGRGGIVVTILTCFSEIYGIRHPHNIE
ncbi:hypothetical protein L9F63_006142, partial [Diploptera punctata]